MKKYIISILFLTATLAKGASFSPGIPLPGLPKSVGPKLMTGSTSVTIATDQTPVPISGSITANNASVGTNYVAAPTSSTLVGYKDPSGNLIPFTGSANGITVTANQGTSPWVTSRNWILNGSNDSVAVTGTVIASVPAGVAITNTPTVNQGTSPWVTSRTWTLNGANDSVAVTGTVSASITGAVTTQPVTVTVSTDSRIANGVGSATLLPVNASRRTVFLYNDSTNTNCYVKFGATASLTSFTIKLFATDTYIMDPPVYTGVIDFICDAASGSMEVNEQ